MEDSYILLLLLKKKIEIGSFLRGIKDYGENFNYDKYLSIYTLFGLQMSRFEFDYLKTYLSLKGYLWD